MAIVIFRHYRFSIPHQQIAWNSRIKKISQRMETLSVINAKCICSPHARRRSIIRTITSLIPTRDIRYRILKGSACLTKIRCYSGLFQNRPIDFNTVQKKKCQRTGCEKIKVKFGVFIFVYNFNTFLSSTILQTISDFGRLCQTCLNIIEVLKVTF